METTKMVNIKKCLIKEGRIKETLSNEFELINKTRLMVDIIDVKEFIKIILNYVRHSNPLDRKKLLQEIKDQAGDELI